MTSASSLARCASDPRRLRKCGAGSPSQVWGSPVTRSGRLVQPAPPDASTSANLDTALLQRLNNFFVSLCNLMRVHLKSCM